MLSQPPATSAVSGGGTDHSFNPFRFELEWPVNADDAQAAAQSFPPINKLDSIAVSSLAIDRQSV